MMSSRRTRYCFEHGFLPRAFLEEREAFIRRLQEHGGKLLYNLYKQECKDARGWCRYKESQYGCCTKKIGDGYAMLCLRFPNPRKSHMCSSAYCVFDKRYSSVRYFTLESESVRMKRVFFLCEWDTERYHYNYGSVPYDFGAIKDKITKIVMKEVWPIVKTKC